MLLLIVATIGNAGSVDDYLIVITILCGDASGFYEHV